VSCRDRFLIHIENKIRSGEGFEQTNREWADIERRAAGLGLDAEDTMRLFAIFLSPRGIQAVNPHFRAVGWVKIVRALEAFANSAEPADVKLFAAHYARALRRFIVTEEEQDAEGTA
jgi:hypothetical protein